MKIKRILTLARDDAGFSLHYLLPVVVIAVIAIAGIRIMYNSHAATPQDTTTTTPTTVNSFSNTYISVKPLNVKETLSRDNPNYALMTTDHSGYTQGLIYGPGFSVYAKVATGYEVYNNSPTQGVGFYESSGGMAAKQLVYIHTYINPSQADGVYTGSVTLKYYVSSSQQWVNGPTINYTITLIDSTASNYIKVSPVTVSENFY